MTGAVGPTSDERPLTIIVPLPPTYRGGTEEYAYRLAGRFAARLPVRIVTTTVREKAGTPAVDIGTIPVERMPGRELFERPVVTGPRARELLERAVRSSRAVQLHMPFPFVERNVTRWAATAGVPVVLTYHMDAAFRLLPGGEGAGFITRCYRGFSARPAIARAGAVVSNSAGYARVSPVLSRYLGRTRVIAKGIAPERLGVDPGDRTVPRREEPGDALLPGSRPEEVRAVFVGRLVAYKGLPVLFEALRRNVDRFPKLRLYVAGKGPMEPSLRELARGEPLASIVRFLGFVPDEALGPLYRSADVVVCPSLNLLESTPTALEEAAACGVRTLGSNLPGTAENLPNDGEHGLLVPPNDPAALADGLAALLSHGPPTTRLPVRTWDDTANEYLALLRELGADVPAGGSAPRFA